MAARLILYVLDFVQPTLTKECDRFYANSSSESSSPFVYAAQGLESDSFRSAGRICAQYVPCGKFLRHLSALVCALRFQLETNFAVRKRSDTPITAIAGSTVCSP
jgi:hypothetical protein